jgi:hypothetical protein
MSDVSAEGAPNPGPCRGSSGEAVAAGIGKGRCALEAGRAIWGLPKWLARSMMTFHRSRVEAQLWDGDELVLTAALDVGSLRIPVPVTAPGVLWACPAGRCAQRWPG